MNSKLDLDLLTKTKIGHLCDSEEKLGMDHNNFSNLTLNQKNEQLHLMRSQLVNEMITAGHKLDEVISIRLPYIDEEVIELLKGRIIIAEEMKDYNLHGNLKSLLSFLQNNIEEQTLSPCMKLLHTCLLIITTDIDKKTYNSKKLGVSFPYEEVMYQLTQSFYPHTRVKSVLNFKSAASSKEYMHEPYVARDVFLKEVGELYRDIKQILKWESLYHHEVNHITKKKIPMITDRSRQLHLASEILKTKNMSSEKIFKIEYLSYIIELAHQIRP